MSGCLPDLPIKLNGLREEGRRVCYFSPWKGLALALFRFYLDQSLPCPRKVKGGYP